VKLSRSCHAVLGLAAVPPWTVNAGIVAGAARTIIVDTGSSAAAALTLLGYAEAIHPGNALLAVVTEPHLDHVLGIATLRERGVQVYGHAGVTRRPEELEAEIAACAGCVTDPVRRARGEARLLFSGARVENPDRSVTGDAELDLGGLAVRLLITPGHTLASLSIHVPDEGVLYTGDCVVEGYLPNLEAGGPAQWGSWLGSLDRIAALAPAVLVPGHGAVVEGPAVLPTVDAVRRVLEEALRTGRAPTGAGVRTPGRARAGRGRARSRRG